MCEHYVARAEEPFRIDELWPFTERLEQYGIAGFSWGAAWLTGAADVPFADHHETVAFRDDHAGRERVGAVETTGLLLHLRRPSRFTWLGLPDTQPFVDPAGRFAFSHNGELGGWRPWRRRFAAQGRIHGKADSEVAARWLEDAWRPGLAPEQALTELHGTFSGLANLAVLSADGTPSVYAGNDENPVFSFRLGRIRIASTGVYSLDRSLFRLAAPGATERALVKQGSTVSI
jgi:glutamine phosphoribosylpyrophosphate amidotransferase